MRRPVALTCLLVLALPSLARAGKKEKVPEPDHVVVQHILISFEGKLPAKNVTRSANAARALAYELLDKARAGEDFAALVERNTDDSFPGVYKMANKGVESGAGEHARDRMVPCFGSVGFGLAPDEVGIADYDPQRCPHGYHVIKRLE